MRWLLALAGLGLGFGFTIIVGQRPVNSWASAQPTSDDQAITVAKVSLPHLLTEIKVEQNEKLQPACLSDRAQLLGGSLTNFNQAIVISGCTRSPVFNQLEKLNLGDEIILVGSNRGRYHYQVIEIKEVRSDDLSLLTQDKAAVVLFTPTDLFATQLFAVVAK